MNPPSTRISIIVPCYNAAAFLRDSLESTLSQSYPPHEVIVVDDGSRDESAEIAESYGPPIRVIRQENQGESAARNRGIAVATGDHLLFLDADDLLDPAALRILAEAVEPAGDRVALMGCAWFADDPTQPFAVRTPPADTFFPKIISGNIGPIHCWLVPRHLVLRAGGFHQEIQQFEDWDLWCQLALTGARLVSLQYIGALYRRHPQCQSDTSPRIERSRGHVAVMRRLSQGMLSDERLLQQHGQDLFWSAWTALHRGRRSGMSWQELEPLIVNIAQVARRGPEEVVRTRYARLIRLVGVRWAEALRSLYLSGDGDLLAQPVDLPTVNAKT